MMKMKLIRIFFLQEIRVLFIYFFQRIKSRDQGRASIAYIWNNSYDYMFSTQKKLQKQKTRNNKYYTNTMEPQKGLKRK